MGRPTNESKKEAKYMAAIYKLRESVRLDYSVYCKLVHVDSNGVMQWKDTKHLKYLCGEVQKFLEEETGNPYDILVINTPPQVGKSMTFSETLASWYIGLHPDDGVMLLSYNDEFAQKFGRKNLDKVQQFGEKLFDIRVSRKKASNNAFEIEGHKGAVISAGLSSGNITGNPARLMIIDDPVRNREEADSANSREKLWSEWKDTMRSRLPAGGKVIVIMTRWHEDDLAGRIIATEPNVRYIRMPMECDEDNDPIGRKIGDSIAPELGKDNAWKDNFKRTCLLEDGVRTWNALYQGLPSSEKGNIMKREWWMYYDELPRIDLTAMSVDCAFEGKQTSDKVAIQVWGKTGANVYMIDSINQQMGFNDTVKQIRNVKNKYPHISMILIEKKANGAAVIDTLQHEIMGIIPIEPRGNKESRVQAILPFIESGNVYLPKFASFTEEFIDQCSSFPRGKNDDMVDAFSQLMTRMKTYKAHAPQGAEARNDFKARDNDSQKHKLFGFKVPNSFMRF